MEGVVAFYAAKDIPGNNNYTPRDLYLQIAPEEIFCSHTVLFYGQPCGVIVANQERLASRAANLVKVKYSSISKEEPLVNIDAAKRSSRWSARSIVNETTDPTDRGTDVKSVVNVEFKVESQYHYTMEPQTCVAKPTEDGMDLYSATQWLDLTNVAVARCLKVPVNRYDMI